MSEQDESGAEPPTGNPVLRWAAGILANVTVITALLVYFGWQRADVMASELGIDESVLGMSTTDYVLRSVGPVLALLVIVGVAGLLWLRLDHALAPRVRDDGRSSRLVRHALRALSVAWLALPMIVWLLWWPFEEQAYVAMPFGIGAGILLTMYGTHLRTTLPGAPEGKSLTLMWTFTAVIAGVCLFWGASNYASVLGVSLAQQTVVTDLTKVTVYSTKRLNLAAGVETVLPAATDKKDAFQYRYSGLRLLNRTGGHWFLIAESWRIRQGVVVMLPDSSSLRMELGG